MSLKINAQKSKVGLLCASLLILCYLAPTSALARISESFPDTSLQIIQMITTMPCLTGLITALLMGKLTTVMYKRHIIIISGFFFLIGGIMPVFVHENVMELLLFAAIMGVGVGVRLTCIASLIYECFDESESSTLLGMQATFICGGGMLFTLLGGLLGSENWYRTYCVYFIVIIVMIIEIICLPKGYLEKKGSEKSVVIKIPGNVIFFAVLGFLVYAFITVYNSNISMLVDIRGLGTSVQAGYAATVYTLAGAIAGIFTGPLIKKLKEFIFVLLSIMAIAGMMICFIAETLPVLYIGGMFCGASFSIFTAASNFFAAFYAGAQNKTVCLSMFSSFANFGQALSPVIIGFVFAAFSIPVRFKGTGIVFVFIAILTFIGAFKMKHHRMSRCEKE